MWCPKTRIIEKVLVLCCAYSTPVSSRRVVSFIHLYNAFLVLLTTYLLCICTALYSVHLNHIIANLKSTQETPAVVWVLHAARRHHSNDVLVLSGRRKASVAVWPLTFFKLAEPVSINKFFRFCMVQFFCFCGNKCEEWRWSHTLPISWSYNSYLNYLKRHQLPPHTCYVSSVKHQHPAVTAERHLRHFISTAR